MDPLYLSILVSAEKKFWRCAQSGEVPHLINVEPPRPCIEAIRDRRHELVEFLGRIRRSSFATRLTTSGPRPSSRR